MKLTLRLLAVAAAVLVAASGYALWRRSDQNGHAGYVTAAVDRGAVASIVTATGTMNPVSTVQVGTYVSGPIQAINVDYNSPVTKGQLVAKIDPRAFVVKVQQAEANLANARARVEKDRADLTFKKLTLQRNQHLLADGLTSQNDVDTAKSDYDQAVAQLALDQASIQQAEAALQEARINLDYTDITSPVDGVVVSRNVDVGQTVAASFQTPTLFLIAQDLTKMQVDTNVSESDIGEVAVGQPVAFTVDAYPSREFRGTVVQVRNAPIVVQNVVTYDVVVGIDNTDLALKPGMTATVAITTAARDDVVRLPLRALRFTPERSPTGSDGSAYKGPPTVWVEQPDGTLRKVEVQLGVRNDQYAELRSDTLQPGDRLAIAFQRGERQESQPPQLPGFAQPRRFR